ncbi:UPF0496 protein 4-like [Syzygium oleosum]|uniref:UPF0496 protein 4-like n=1 Tax=Syzygium oleosum TaxID=219896 RepID=UPI0011D1FA7F|nr:UPF0496 protein 4-like [Syzygium oleosum]
MEDHFFHHNQPDHLQSQLFSSLLESFESDVSSRFKSLFLNPRPVSEYISFSWIHRCFELLPYMNRAFSKLVVELDHPMSKWEADAAEAYLSYSLNLLEHMNLISSSISHLGQTRVCLSHALSLADASPSNALERLKALQPEEAFTKDLKVEETKEDGDQERACSGKDLLVHKALIFMKGIEFWVCGILLSALTGDPKPYMGMRTGATKLLNSSLVSLESGFYEELLEKGSVLKEVRDIKGSVACLVAAMEDGKSSNEVGELKMRLEGLEKMLDGLSKEVDGLFSEMLASRNQVIDCSRPGTH